MSTCAPCPNWGRWGKDDELRTTRKRWEFLLTLAPLRLKNVTGSPVNPIALF
ncbi:MAG TPA: hypothetical protein VGT00_02675 [Methylomirabilota bacterium]|nr:hypothetical protein [Methylomirabilota bacterium]